MSVKISTLPAAAAATGADQGPVVQGGVTKRASHSQLATFMETALTSLSINGVATTFNSDGSAVIGNSRYNFNVDGTGLVVNDAFTAGSGINVGAGPGAFINTDGSGFLSQNLIYWDAGGNLTINGGFIHDAAGNWQISTDGSAVFGQLQINVDGSITSPGVSRTLFNHFADAGSVGAGETDLYSDNIVASILFANGQKLIAEYGVALVNSVSTKRLRVYFGGTAIFDSGALTVSASSEIVCYVTIQRVDVNTVRYSITANTTGASTGSFAQVGSLGGLNLAAANILKITGQAGGAGTANGDLTAKDAYVEFKP